MLGLLKKFDKMTRKKRLSNHLNSDELNAYDMNYIVFNPIVEQNDCKQNIRNFIIGNCYTYNANTL